MKGEERFFLKLQERKQKPKLIINNFDLGKKYRIFDKARNIEYSMKVKHTNNGLLV